MEQYTPMIKQYLRIKKEHEECILFFRLGDFYEMFFEDAKYAAKILDITLTARDGGGGKKIDMCGIPYHSADAYIQKLIASGEKVAICEQIEDAKASKGLVKRDVVRIITPGTLVDSEFLNPEENNYLLAVVNYGQEWGFSHVDISTGEFSCGAGSKARIMDHILGLAPREIILSESLREDALLQEIIRRLTPVVNYDSVMKTKLAEQILCEQLGVLSLEGFGIELGDANIQAAGILMQYLQKTQQALLPQINKLDAVNPEKHMLVDHITRRNLELTETLRGGNTKGSLLWLLKKTKSAMGSRLLRAWMLSPLVDLHQIKGRQDAVSTFVNNALLLKECRETLAHIHDVERILSKAGSGRANARDLRSLASSLEKCPILARAIANCGDTVLQGIASELLGLENLVAYLNSSLALEPPANLRDGGFIRSGFDDIVDDYRDIMNEGRKWIAALELKEKENTNIRSLKVGFNKVFGYYLEVTKANLGNVPKHYIRKQTLANSERYITPELKEREEQILAAEEGLIEREQEVFTSIREKVVSNSAHIQRVAKAVAKVDVLMSFAVTAKEYNYVKPKISDKGGINICGGRHPVVEKVMGDSSFVPNDTLLSCDKSMQIITGPNMSGKSTYMRQVALIVLLAQIGSYVPANSASIGIVDRLFTRVGASDDIFSGQSTFMVEMIEVANICNNATVNSLVILDEIGRGTSTFDGISIARAVVEYLHNEIGCLTLFATHYHELTTLDSTLPGVKNLSIAVYENGKDIVFLRKIVEGAANKSYGIHVAELAGVPDGVIKKANEYIKQLELRLPERQNTEKHAQKRSNQQLSIYDHPILEKIKEVDPSTIAPLDALKLLYEWKAVVTD